MEAVALEDAMRRLEDLVPRSRLPLHPGQPDGHLDSGLCLNNWLTVSAKSMFSFGLLVLVLLFRPQGILGRRRA